MRIFVIICGLCIFLIPYRSDANQTKTFPDIGNHWAKSSIESMATQYQIPGYMGTEFFRPDLPITRAELAWLLTLIKNIQYPISQETIKKRTAYSDVRLSYWAYPYIEALATYNFFTKIEDTKFAPNSYITRIEWIKILLKWSGLKEFTSNRFLTSDSSPLYEDNKWIVTAYDLKLIPSHWKIESEFEPYRLVTRAEIMDSLYKANKMSKEMDNKSKEKQGFSEMMLPMPLFTKPHTTIKNIWCEPNSIPVNGSQLLHLYVLIQFPTPETENSKACQILVDLSSINRMENFQLYDTGHWGDQKADDHIYSGVVLLPPGIAPGKKIFPFVIEEENDRHISGEFIVEVVSLEDYQKLQDQKEETPSQANAID